MSKIAIASIIGNVVLIVALIIFSQGCMTYPDRDDYTLKECYHADVCLYYSAKAGSALDCSLRHAACRKRLLQETCSKPENRLEGQTFQNCWDKLD